MKSTAWEADYMDSLHAEMLCVLPHKLIWNVLNDYTIKEHILSNSSKNNLGRKKNGWLKQLRMKLTGRPVPFAIA
jgi:hypothetical protein